MDVKIELKNCINSKDDFMENKEPKSELAQQLKMLLDNMTQDEFDEEWSKIVAIGFTSPNMAEYSEFLETLQKM